MNKKSPIRAKDENAPLPVAFFGSKTSVLKLSIRNLGSLCLTSLPFNRRADVTFGVGEGWRRDYHSWNLKQQCHDVLAIFQITLVLYDKKNTNGIIKTQK